MAEEYPYATSSGHVAAVTMNFCLFDMADLHSSSSVMRNLPVSKRIGLPDTVCAIPSSSSPDKIRSKRARAGESSERIPQSKSCGSLTKSSYRTNR